MNTHQRHATVMCAYNGEKKRINQLAIILYILLNLQLYGNK